MLKCVLTGTERITNKSYLKKRLDALNIPEDEFRKYYISKVAVQNLALSVRNDGLRDTAIALGHSQTDVLKLLTYNGKNRQLLDSLKEKLSEVSWEAPKTAYTRDDKGRFVVRDHDLGGPVDKVLDMDYSNIA
jgi:hypothetical protein